MSASFEIMRRAGMLLTAHSEQKNIPPEGVVSQLEHIDEDMITFAALFKSMFKGKANIDFSLVRGIDVRSASAAEIDEQVKKTMVALAEENYRLEPEVPKEIAKKLKSVNKKTTFTYITKAEAGKEPVLMAYLRIDDNNDGSVYVGSFNVNNKLRGAAIGEHLLAETVNQLHDSYDIKAVVVPEIAAGTHYVEKNGFIGTSFVPSEQAKGTLHGWFDIEIPRRGAELKSELRKKTESEIADVYTKKFAKNKDPLKHSGEPYIIAEFSIKDDLPQLTAVCDKLLNEQGYTLTRYFCRDNSCNRRIYGFEKLSS